MENETQAAMQQENAQPQEQSKRVRPELAFEVGDVITDGIKFLGVFDHRTDEYLWFSVGCTIGDKGISGFSEIESIDAKPWRKVTDFEKSMFGAHLKRTLDAFL